MTEKAKVSDVLTSVLMTKSKSDATVKAGGVFTVECFGADGAPKWVDTFHNIVVSTGLANMNNAYFGAAAQTITWYLGLVTGPGSGTTFAISDTLAAHSGWVENTSYSGARKAMVFGSATVDDPSVVTNSASPSSFTATASATIAGAFVCSVSSGTAGVLFSAGDFGAGDKAITAGDILNVTYTFTLDGT